MHQIYYIIPASIRRKICYPRIDFSSLSVVPCTRNMEHMPPPSSQIDRVRRSAAKHTRKGRDCCPRELSRLGERHCKDVPRKGIRHWGLCALSRRSNILLEQVGNIGHRVLKRRSGRNVSCAIIGGLPSTDSVFRLG
jgi:hypothetical protein